MARADAARAEIACADVACADVACADVACAGMARAGMARADMASADIAPARMASAGRASILVGPALTGKRNSTRVKLLAAAAQSLRYDGLAALSARVVAGRAGVNQALIFYHFGSVAELVDAASREAVDATAAYYHDKFAEVTSFNELLTLGREMHERERAAGNVAMMAQLMSGAQWDETLAGAARYAMQRWNEEIEVVVHRVMQDNPLAEICEPAGLARAISAGFLGLELYEGIDKAGGEAALDALERLGDLVAVIDELGPLASRAIRAKVRTVPTSG